MFYWIDMKKHPEKCEITVKIALFGVSSSSPFSSSPLTHRDMEPRDTNLALRDCAKITSGSLTKQEHAR